jgi:ABC-type Mn2+/Zn2+ transport system ATPase subunit
MVLRPVAAAAPAALVVSGLGVRYSRQAALRDVDFTLQRGEVVAVVGPNGAGKSTLFRSVVGLLPHAGTVTLHGTHCHHRRHRLNAAYLPQRSDLDLDFPITVAEVVAMGRRRFLPLGRRPREVDRRAVADALALVDLPDLGRRPIGSLSGGELQRVFVARAIAQEADVLLLDEALSGVDEPATADILDLLDALARQGAAVLISTHDLALARRRFDRCLALNRRLVADGPPQTCLEGALLEATFGSGAAVGPPSGTPSEGIPA